MDEIDRFLAEDLNEEGDVTSNALFTTEQGQARIISKEQTILAGLEEAKQVFDRTGAQLQMMSSDGLKIQSGEIIATVEGPVKSILMGERLALNILGRMSGIADQTKSLVNKCQEINPKINIAATRKTTPGFRKYEKKAVRLGGGDSHRFGLFDAVMIKDNHIVAKGSFQQAIKDVLRNVTGKIIEVEVDTEEQALQAAEMNVDVIMLDNFSAREAKKLAKKIRFINPSITLEISGGITPENIIDYVSFADRISLGYLTHTLRNKDFSLEIVSK
jgi:nicotinate-nucleotide pyrophosphorylase (carboxylating)